MNTKHLGLFRSYLPHLNSESCTIFFKDTLFFKEYSIKISIFFSTDSTGSQSFSSARVHRSRFEYGALGLVSIISPSSELRITYHFLRTPCFLKNILSKFQFISQPTRSVPKVSVQPEFIGAGSNMEHLGLFRSYLFDPNLKLHNIFLDGLLVLQGIFFQNFKFF